MQNAVPSGTLPAVPKHPIMDVAAACILATCGVISIIPWRDDVPANTLLFSTAGVLLATLPVAIRRHAPWPALGLAIPGYVLITPAILSDHSPLTLLAVAISGVLIYYTVLSTIPRVPALLVTGLGAVAVVLLAIRLHAGMPGFIATAGLLAAALAAEQPRRRAEVAKIRLAGDERVLAAQRRQAAMAERARIAREMHDVVAHSIAMIAVQAEAAPYTVPDLDGAARAEFADIATVARRTLAELRSMLGVLRADVPAGPETAPQPGLDRLDDLIAEHGGPVDLDIVGDPVPLPQAVEVSAYRIVQECLANARAHAPGSRVSVELAYRPKLLAIRVANDAGTAEDGPADRATAAASAGLDPRHAGSRPADAAAGPVSGPQDAGPPSDPGPPAHRPRSADDSGEDFGDDRRDFGDAGRSPEADSSSDLGAADRPREAAGYGLVGMRERAAALGGWFSAGPSATGFLVTAGLPIP
ncbi:hypothetical protein Sru01_58930 [Sphaerisporangium rufum]|uniref:histidine kinase n=1 Tax=Sphaerisporangium rufum TaxID=1381558 RepID=A0A919R9I0_9ACTN|nr:sensor histidine kinase [Sphaerisporangium rufum]GII80911.1 hypothetical protein Sru01_58930 [Sphaerisporangium rufum]